MNFKSSEQLIARVSKTLNTFKSSGLLDEGDFYGWIKDILVLLNIPSYTPVHTVLDLESNKLRIPDDMYQLWSVWKYEEEYKVHEKILHPQRQVKYLIQEDRLDTQCEDNCDVITHTGDIMTTRYYIEETPVTRNYIFKAPIRINNYTTNKCIASSPSVNITSPFTASMDSNYFYFNFEGGSVYLQYYKLMLDEYNTPMIPDVSEIELAIETYIIYRFFQELYYNSTTDALQRMQYAEVQYIKAFDKAKTWVKTPSARELFKIAQKNKNRFNMFELRPSR